MIEISYNIIFQILDFIVFFILKNLEFALFNIMNNIGQILLTLLIYFYIAVFSFISNCFIISIASPCFFACFTK